MDQLFTFLENEGVDKSLLEGVRAFRSAYPTEPESAPRIPSLEY